MFGILIFDNFDTLKGVQTKLQKKDFVYILKTKLALFQTILAKKKLKINHCVLPKLLIQHLIPIVDFFNPQIIKI